MLLELSRWLSELASTPVELHQTLESLVPRQLCLGMIQDGGHTAEEAAASLLGISRSPPAHHSLPQQSFQEVGQVVSPTAPPATPNAASGTVWPYTPPKRASPQPCMLSGPDLISHKLISMRMAWHAAMGCAHMRMLERSFLANLRAVPAPTVLLSPD